MMTSGTIANVTPQDYQDALAYIELDVISSLGLYLDFFWGLLILVGSVFFAYFLVRGIIAFGDNYASKRVEKVQGVLERPIYEQFILVLLELVLVHLYSLAIFLVWWVLVLDIGIFDAFGQPLEFGVFLPSFFVMILLGLPIGLISVTAKDLCVLYYRWKGKSKQWIAMELMSRELNSYL